MAGGSAPGLIQITRVCSWKTAVPLLVKLGKGMGRALRVVFLWHGYFYRHEPCEAISAGRSEHIWGETSCDFCCSKTFFFLNILKKKEES